MYLNGGVIAYFILFNAMHIYNTYWVYILPALFGGFYNVIIFNTNFKSIPESLFESAKIDGASEYTIFFKLVIPLSKPVISALGIFTAVATWNDYTQTLYYTKSAEIQTLSYYMLSITKASASAAQLGETMSAGAASVLTTVSNSAANYKTIELACMVLSALPLIIMYPFAQKFFEKGCYGWVSEGLIAICMYLWQNKKSSCLKCCQNREERDMAEIIVEKEWTKEPAGRRIFGNLLNPGSAGR